MICNFLDFLWVVKFLLINVSAGLNMLGKLVTPGLLKITLFWNKVYDGKTFFDDITHKVSVGSFITQASENTAL